MERIPEVRESTRQFPIGAKVAHTFSTSKKEVGIRGFRDFDLAIPIQTWKGKTSYQEEEDLMVDAGTIKRSDDSLEDSGSTSFHGASHPPEPVDTDLMRPVYVPIGQNKADGKCLVKNVSLKGPFLDDLSIRMPNVKPSPSLLSPAESLVEEPNDLGVISSPFTVPRPSQNTETSLPPDSEEKECIWDASLPPSGNVSPLSSIDSTGVVRSMSIVNSCTSTYRSDVLMSDGMLSVDRNYESTKGSIRGDSLESGKTSLSRASDSSGLSDDSNWSNITGSANKPHKGNDPRWKAILAIRARDGILGMSHFKLLKRLGCGDIGSVYLSELSGTRCYFAMKVMDKASLASRKKLTRAQTEREILQLLDHPFLPTLYTHFETDRFSCLVMEYCPGGDLHTLRQRQPGKHFSEYAARFYAAEVLLALEYLHMLGVVYRDLKPENVLVRDDGHIMLSDFDLSLRCAVSPTLIRTSSDDPSKRGAAFCVQPACIEPTTVCMQPACFLPRLFPQKSKKKTPKPRADSGFQANSMPELVAEPTSARSMSFVGTHEYLAPEIIKGEGHGSAVDWWTFGIFLHELLYGKTPFKGSGNRATLFNVVGQQLKFPDSPATSYASRDLIRGLLVKEPQNRLGVKRGATEIKQHPFFEGVNWALIRCSTPPEVPRPVEPDYPAKYGQVNPVGVGNTSKRVVGADAKSDDKLSRKYSIVAAAIVFIIGGVLQTAAVDYAMLTFARFFGGLGVGMLSAVAPLYIAEISPPEIRGTLLVLEELSIVTGIVIAFWTSYGTLYIASEWSWRLPFLIQIIPALVLGVGIVFLPFSPRWLCSKDRDDDALAALSKLRQLPPTDHRILREWFDIRAEVALHAEISAERHPHLQERTVGNRIKLEVVSWIDLFKKGCWRRTFVGSGLMFFQQFVGINALIYYSPTLFETMGLEYNMQLIMSGVLNCVQLVGVASSLWSMDRIGRRPLLLWGSLIMFVSHLIISVLVGKYSHDWPSYRPEGWASVAMLLVYMLGFGASWGPVPWAMPSEVFPSTLRAKGVAFSTSCNWLFNFIIGLITPPLVENTGFGAYVFFAVFCLLSLFWVYFFVPETAGKTLEEMDNVFGDDSSAGEEARRERIEQAIAARMNGH